MSGLTEWIKNELYPTVYDSLDTVFPELEFRRYPGGWKSKYKLDLTLPKQKRDDKTVATKKYIGRILEQGGDSISYIEYITKGRQLSFIDAVKFLALEVNLTLPKDEEFNQSGFIEKERKQTFLEDCNSYFANQLVSVQTKEGYRRFELNEFLEFRGYSLEDCKDMELGYIPDQEELYTYLLNRGYTQNFIDENLAINVDSRIGLTHVLTIPYRSGGAIKGFKFRTVDYQNTVEDADVQGYSMETKDKTAFKITPKYLNSKGLDRNSGFFNIQGIKGDKDVVIVEGELDSLHATVRGVDNVVATGGSSISSEQIKDAVKKGAKSFSICFDNETGKEESTAKNIDRAIEVILGEGVNRIYIVTLPALGGSKTDPDRLIQEKGVEAFKEAVEEAFPYYEYWLQRIIKKYGKIEEETERGLQPKDIDNLLEEVLETASQIKDAIDKDRYKKLFTYLLPIRKLGVTEESLSIALDKLTSTRDRAVRDKDFTKLLGKAKELHDKGETVTALDLLDSSVKEIKLQDKATEFSSLLIPVKENELIQRLIAKPDSLKSGYTIGGEELLLPSGAISVFCAPTSHGKTTFLINTALNIAQSNIGKEVHLFSYEEDRDSILINALNTYLDTQLSNNNRTTLRNNFTGGNSRTIEGKDTFFKELIDSKKLNIHYTNYNSDTLIEAIRYLHKHANPGAIFIDYIQLLNLPEGKYKTYSRQEEMKEICIALKDLAVETGLPIILGAQFNREVTNQLKIHATKIGEAGDIERIANLIVGFWNNTFKPLNPTEVELKDINSKGANTPNSLYTVVLKNRGGRVGLEEILSFNGNTGKIKNSSSLGYNLFK